MKFKKLLVAYILIAIQTASVLSFGLHRFHTTLTRIDYNAEQKIYEITIQVFTHDLEAILKKRNVKSIDLEKATDTDTFIFDYLKENFVLTDRKGETKTLKWIGKEIDADSIRIYLEADSTEISEGFRLQNTLFFESYPEQANLVICRYDGKKADLLFKIGDKIKEINETKSPVEK